MKRNIHTNVLKFLSSKGILAVSSAMLLVSCTIQTGGYSETDGVYYDPSRDTLPEGVIVGSTGNQVGEYYDYSNTQIPTSDQNEIVYNRYKNYGANSNQIEYPNSDWGVYTGAVTNYYDWGYGGWGSPYGYYSGWGWNMGFGFGYGFGYSNWGWGMNPYWGWNNPWYGGYYGGYHPYHMYNPYYFGGYYPYGYGYYGNSFGYNNYNFRRSGAVGGGFRPTNNGRLNTNNAGIRPNSGGIRPNQNGSFPTQNNGGRIRNQQNTNPNIQNTRPSNNDGFRSGGNSGGFRSGGNSGGFNSGGSTRSGGGGFRR